MEGWAYRKLTGTSRKLSVMQGCGHISLLHWHKCVRHDSTISGTLEQQTQCLLPHDTLNWCFLRICNWRIACLCCPILVHALPSQAIIVPTLQMAVLEYRMDRTVVTSDDPPAVLGKLPESLVCSLGKNLKVSITWSFSPINNFASPPLHCY